MKIISLFELFLCVVTTKFRPVTQSTTNESNASEREPSESEDDQSSTSANPNSIKDNVEETHYTEYLKVKGSTDHDNFQKALRKCAQETVAS